MEGVIFSMASHANGGHGWPTRKGTKVGGIHQRKFFLHCRRIQVERFCSPPAAERHKPTGTLHLNIMQGGPARTWRHSPHLSPASLRPLFCPKGFSSYARLYHQSSNGMHRLIAKVMEGVIWPRASKQVGQATVDRIRSVATFAFGLGFSIPLHPRF